jgi:hypothetical protein
MAKKAKPGLQAAQKYLGLVKNAQGKWVKPGAALATKTLAAGLNNPNSANYRPSVPGATGTTPIANRQGERMGFFSGAGAFTLAGGAKGRTTATGKHAATMAGITTDSIAATSAPPFAESDIAQTSLLGAQGKAYAAGRQGTSGTLLGATSKPVMPEAEKKRGGRKRGRKGKGKAKGRKH